MSEPNQTLRKFLEPMTFENPMGHLNLMLLPFWGERQGRIDYMLGSTALGTGLLKITEVGAHGSVPELMVESTCETMILLLDGEELVGAKQNRILNTTVLVPPKARMKIPVSCVEQGRWNSVSPEFKSGDYSPSTLRARKNRDVTENLRRSGRHESNQGAVWAEVAHCINAAGSFSPTMAMHDAIEQQRNSLRGYTEALKYPGRATGVVAAIGGEFSAIDLFDKPETLELMWNRLITGYALDALGQPEKKEKTFTVKGAEALLDHVKEIPCQLFPSVGAGQEWRFEAEDIVGQALVLDETCVHLCVFPNDRAKNTRNEEGRILPPSRRRRQL